MATPAQDIEFLHIAPDGTKLAYAANEEGYSKLVIRNLSDGAEQVVSDLPHGVINSLSWSPRSDRLTFDFNSPVHNLDVWLYDLADGKVQQISHSPRGGLNFNSFQNPALIKYPTFDGLQIPAWWYLPANAKADGTTPVVSMYTVGRKVKRD